MRTDTPIGWHVFCYQLHRTLSRVHVSSLSLSHSTLASWALHTLNLRNGNKMQVSIFLNRTFIRRAQNSRSYQFPRASRLQGGHAVYGPCEQTRREEPLLPPRKDTPHSVSQEPGFATHFPPPGKSGPLWASVSSPTKPKVQEN